MSRCNVGMVWRSVVAELSEAINLDEIAVGLPRTVTVTARQVAKAPDRIALVENGASRSYRDLEQRVREIAAVLSSLGIRTDDFDVLRSHHVVGTLLPGVEGRLRTIDGIPLSKEQVGELHVRGRNVMRGYYPRSRADRQGDRQRRLVQYRQYCPF